MDLHHLDHAAMAGQLAQPSGEIGVELGRRMNDLNRSHYAEAGPQMGLSAHHRILEIGCGNGCYVSELLGLAEGLFYFGLDISETMVSEARKMNRDLIERGSMALAVGSVMTVPLQDGSFDCALAINTSYFWEDFVSAATEIRRVLRKEGRLVLMASTPDETNVSPYVKYGFHLYDDEQLAGMAGEAGFHAIRAERKRETIPTLDGMGTRQREFTLLTARA